MLAAISPLAHTLKLNPPAGSPTKRSSVAQLPPLPASPSPFRQPDPAAAAARPKRGSPSRATPQLPSLAHADSSLPGTPAGRLSILGFDSGARRAVRGPASTAEPRTAPGHTSGGGQLSPPNFRIGLIEAGYDGEIVTALDVVEYYATYGHSANIKIFHLVRESDGVVPSPYNLRARSRNTF
jgi:hypothetical protein